MKEALAAIGILALAVSLWFVKGYSDERVFDSKNETIESLKSTAQSKEDNLLKSNALLDSKDATINLLRESLEAKEDILKKNTGLIDSENATIKSLQEALQSNEATIAKDNDLIASYQQQPQVVQPQPAPKEEIDVVDTGEKIYPEDNGFEAQNLGSGFSAYQVFGPIKNPHHVPFPDKIPNRTPWKFGSGNSGIAANGSGLFLSGATNFDSDGVTSENGQAGFLEFAGSSISQSVELPSGTYSVTFDYEGRQNYSPANRISVTVDGTELFKGAPTACDHFEQVTTGTFKITKSGKHQLMFRGLGAVGDVSGFHTTFIDNVCFNIVKTYPPVTDDNPEQVSVPPEENEKIYPKDNGFDTQDLKSGFSSYQYFGETIKNPNNNQMPKRISNMTPWTFGGNAGIGANGSGFYVTGATNLDSNGANSTNGQAGFLEYADSSISQKIQLPAGTFTVSFDYEGRRDYLPANQVAVSIDGTVLFKGAPTNSDQFKRVTTDPITITAAGKHELMFRALGGLNNSAYPCTFIDNICIDVVKLQTTTPPPDIRDLEREISDGGPVKAPTHL